MKKNNSIAIIGMACTAPGAHSPEELWQNVLAGRRYFRKAPDERMPRKWYYDPDPEAPGKTYCDQMAVITDWVFDPYKFKIAPITQNASDIAHWLALDTTAQLFENLKLDLNAIDKARVGIILGNSLAGEFSRSHNMALRVPFIKRTLEEFLKLNKFSSDQAEQFTESFLKFYKAPLPEPNEDTLAGNMSNVIAGRIAYNFDFGGGAYAVDGACSSSLLSVVHGCNALMNGELDFAVASGVDVSLDPFEIVGFAKTKALTKSDIKPYDKNADGMLPGEACGILLLEREEDAIKNGHYIHAVLKGWGYSSDGRTGGITAPKVEGQMRALNNAYKVAGYPISSVQLFEGHGTGTPVGDAVELECIKRLLDNAGSENISRIGSLKSNIGHCKAAAGVMGIIKATLALNRKILPPTTNCTEPSPVFGLPLNNFEPATKPEIWKSNGKPRRASVSGMGFGGSNGHVTLEEANPKGKPIENDLNLLFSSQKTEIIFLDADSPEDLNLKVKNLIPIANRICRAELTDLSAALSKKIEKRKYRLAIIAESPWNLYDQLTNINRWLDENRSPEEIHNPSEGLYIGEAKDTIKIAGLFPGQGSHFINMGEQLKERYKFINELYEASDKSVKDIFPDLLSTRIFTNFFRLSDEQLKVFENTLKNTGTAQPAIVLSSMAMLKMLEYFGIQPDVCLGHSLGEISAMAASGIFDEEMAVRIAALRGKSKTDLDIPDPGAMAATVAPSEKVEEILKEFKNEIIAVANYNSPSQTVVSGSSSAVEHFVQKCKEYNYACRLLPVSHAFHSEIVAPASVAFEKSLIEIDLDNKIKKGKSLSRFISTATGDYLKKDADIIKLLSEHIRKPVRFIEAVEKANEECPDLWIEIGPGGVLSGLVKTITGNDTVCLTSNIKGEELFTSLNHLLAQCFVSGVNIKTDRLFDFRFYREFDPENYNPVFITNPCERKVNIEELGLGENQLIGSGLLPEMEGVNQYLEHRKEYIKELIELDFKHFKHTSRVQGDTSETEKPAALPKQEEKIESESDYVGFAINWISKRTGIPKERIKPEMRLRDDLNLDSIRAGELVITLSKEMQAEKTIGDPSVFANSKISDIIVQISLNSKKEDDHQSLIKNQIDKVDNSVVSQHWVNTFLIKRMEYPLDSSNYIPFEKNSQLSIVCDEKDFQFSDLTRLLNRKNIEPQVISWENISEINTKSNNLLLILPSVKTPFFGQSADAFQNQWKTTLSKVYAVLKNNLDPTFNFPAGFRCMIVNLNNRNEQAENEYNAFHSLLKSLKLEHKEANFKMLSLPDSIRNITEIIVEEMEHFSERIYIEYDKDQRVTRVAAPIEKPGKHKLLLTKKDVIIVSGGGKGITFQHALALGKEYGVKLALLGTSPLPNLADEKENELAANLTLLEEKQISYVYIQCDVTDPESVKKAFVESEKGLGTVTGIFHGAGISRFNLFKDKSFEEFFECFEVKAFGLFNLLKTCKPEKLKMLHVISSVLGHTGMRSQCDYNFANAWLDGAVNHFKEKHPNTNCLTLGYTVWGETGLGKKMGALDYLKTVGVHPLTIDEGISSYLHILKTIKNGGNFVITGRLSNDLEANLFAPLQKMKGRFLERILRFVPQTEMVSEFTLSHETDLYLSEHIYNGTPIMPAVMEIEAMVQNVLQCMGTKQLPVLKNIRFHTPIIVPKGEKVTIRIMATARHLPCETHSFYVLIKSNTDQFDKNYIEAECIFENEVSLPEDLPLCPELGEPLPVNPDELSPYPLFQGKLFRRIEKIYKQEFEKDCITTIRVPEGERYFSEDYDKEIYFGSPAVRDSAYQSGLLIVSEGSLPDIIQEIRLTSNYSPGTILTVKLSKLIKKGPLAYEVSFALYNQDREVVAFENMLLKKPEKGALEPPLKKAKPINIDRIGSDLGALMPDFKHSVAILTKGELENAIENNEITNDEINRLREEYGEPRIQAVLSNLLVTRRAVVNFAKKYKGNSIKSSEIKLQHRKDGKPILSISDAYPDKNLFNGIDISIADCGSYSVAFIGPGKVGVDIEQLEYRDAETWLGLLGRDGYNLALEITETTNEIFDVSATRVWTLIEASKKANNLIRIVPANKINFLGGSWLSFSINGQEIICGNLVNRNTQNLLSICYEPTEIINSDNIHLTKSFDIIEKEFREQMDKFTIEFKGNSIDNEPSGNYLKFDEFILDLCNKLEELTKIYSPELLMDYRKRFYSLFEHYSKKSTVFKRCLLKPEGYPGDYVLMNNIYKNEILSNGIGYYLDKRFLKAESTESIRQRSNWVIKNISKQINSTGLNSVTILDIGCGPMYLEKELINYNNKTDFNIIGVDYDKNALNFAKNEIQSKAKSFKSFQLNILDPVKLKEVLNEISEVDFIICMGLFDYLSNDKAIGLIKGIKAACKSTTELFIGNYQPNLTNRTEMEWMLDWWLEYKDQDQIENILIKAGINSFNIQLDKTGNYLLVKANCYDSNIDNFMHLYFETLSRYSADFKNDPSDSNTENHYKKFKQLIDSLKEIEKYEKSLSQSEIIDYRKKFQSRLIPFIKDSQIFSHSLLKPLGYAGDFQLLEKLSKEEINTNGIAYHFDRIQIDYPATVAVKNRINWISSEVLKMLENRNSKKLKILDIGIGAGPIERKLIRIDNRIEIELVGVDFEKKALDFLNNEFIGTKVSFSPVHLNLRDKDAPNTLKKLSEEVDICLAVGILEAFNDKEAIEILKHILNGLPKNSVLFTENYLQDHPSRFFMEWYMDFYLGYRSQEQLVRMIEATGVSITDLQVKTDDTNSLALIKVIK
ncbi:MAG: SDR family NAD(P)-dependent oxidoreductase [Bacteroidetes bacterium]|nr:SDR family NAD(P)-dependent oxidoreductase [Bacteroidota bacterium]